MKVLIKKAKIIAPKSAHHLQTLDIWVKDGRIAEIGQNINQKADQVIEGQNLHVSGGFLDLRCFSQDPGQESMESLNSLTHAAAKGGFTEVVVMPNTTPIMQHKEGLAYLMSYSKYTLTTLSVAAAVTKDTDGKDFTEMWDLKNAGAVAFTDGSKPLWNSDILFKTLQYLYPKNALLMNRAEEPTLAVFGQMHEGITSTSMGTKGIPSEAEEIMVMRDLKLLEYANLSSETPLLHFSCISTAAAVKLIKKAKANGLAVSCDIAAHQLAFTDEDLVDFDTNLKVSPPFRSRKDIKALQKGLEEGTIDAIVTDHHPLDEEHKNLEFDLAYAGIIGLQTAFSVANTYSGLNTEQLVEKLVDAPRRILRKPMLDISEGQAAELTVFDPTADFILTEKDIVSLSKNTPFINKLLKGKVIATLNKDQISINQ